MLKEICIIGIKVLAGIVAGGAVVAGINHVTSSTAKARNLQNAKPQNEPEVNRRYTMSGDSRPQHVARRENTPEFVQNVHKFQDNCLKGIALVQSLVTMVDSINSVLNPHTGRYLDCHSFYQENDNYYGGGGGYRGVSRDGRRYPYEEDGVIHHSPSVIEYLPKSSRASRDYPWS